MSDKQIVEWGVRHSQGIRTEPNEQAARESLVQMTKRYEENHRNKVKPVIVSRTITPWTEVLDAIPCDSCGDETTDPSRCDHGEELCPDCRDQGACSLCEREDAADYVAEMRADR